MPIDDALEELSTVLDEVIYLKEVSKYITNFQIGLNKMMPKEYTGRELQKIIGEMTYEIYMTHRSELEFHIYKIPYKSGKICIAEALDYNKNITINYNVTYEGNDNIVDENEIMTIIKDILIKEVNLIYKK
jgi:hypothetical protein